MNEEIEKPSVEKSPYEFKPDGTKRHPSIAGVLKHFQNARARDKQFLPTGFSHLALALADHCPEGPDLTCALRDLLTAMDSALRA